MCHLRESTSKLLTFSFHIKIYFSIVLAHRTVFKSTNGKNKKMYIFYLTIFHVFCLVSVVISALLFKPCLQLQNGFNFSILDHFDVIDTCPATCSLVSQVQNTFSCTLNVAYTATAIFSSRRLFRRIAEGPVRQQPMFFIPS